MAYQDVISVAPDIIIVLAASVVVPKLTPVTNDLIQQAPKPDHKVPVPDHSLAIQFFNQPGFVVMLYSGRF